jgi:hypothetical protein
MKRPCSTNEGERKEKEIIFYLILVGNLTETDTSEFLSYVAV